ncbi:MAG: hypothetical protein HC898_06470 [Phycisphaerales bacterium]|nr:hypothetical protein [Phycisphaerales bacterium]
MVQRFKNADLIEIQFKEVWFDQHDSFYFYKPAHLYERISLAISGNVRRHNKHMHAFMDWIFAEVGRIRLEERQARKQGGQTHQPRSDWSFAGDMTELALQLRMAPQVSKRNWGRIRDAINNSAILAQQAQIITGSQWQGDQLVIHFNQKTFADLDQYHEALEVKRTAREQRLRRRRQAQQPEVSGVEWPYPRPIRDYSPNQLKEMKLGQLAELAKWRQKLRDQSIRQEDGSYRPRPANPDEAMAIAFHDAVVKMIDHALVPRPGPAAPAQ